MLCMISIHECCRVGGSFMDELCGVSRPVEGCITFLYEVRIGCICIIVSVAGLL